MDIIHYKKEHAREVAGLFREIFAENGWTERPSDHMDSPDKLFETKYGGILLLVFEKDKLIGTAGIKMLTQTEGLMKRFYIRRERRGTGVAQKLLHELTKKANLLGTSKIVLDVSRKLPRAIRFYEKSGFTRMTTAPRDDWSETQSPEVFYYYFRNIT